MVENTVVCILFKKKVYAYHLVYVFGMLYALIMLTQVKQYIGIEPYPLAHHFLTYELGFIPRAFWGSTIGQLTQVVPFKVYFLLWLVLTSAIFPLWWYYALSHYAESKNQDYIIWLSFFALCLPSTWLLYKDLFRFDCFNFAVFAVCAAILWNRHWLRYCIPLIMVVMVMTHEAALLMFVPTLCGMAIYRTKNLYQEKCFILSMILGAIAAAFCYYIARQTPMNTEYVEKYICNRCFYSWRISFRPYLDNIANGSGHINLFLDHCKNSVYVWQLLLSIPFIVCGGGWIIYFWMQIYSVIKEFSTIEKCKYCILILSMLPNLLLFIGCDWMRWLGMLFSVNLTILFLFFADKNMDRFFPISTKSKCWILFVSILFLCCQVGDWYSYTGIGVYCSEIFAKYFPISKFF